MKLTFVTTNHHKFQTLSNSLSSFGINLTNESLETPEIQDSDLIKIVEYSANWAIKEINQPLLVNDFGYFIRALNGFPGPFSKQVIDWFCLEDWQRLLSGLEDRTVVVKWAYALAAPGKKTRSIVFTMKGKLASKPEVIDGGNNMQRFYIPEGFEKTYSDLSESERQKYQKSKHSFIDLADFIKIYF